MPAAHLQAEIPRSALFRMRVAVVGKGRKMKPLPLTPSPFRGGGTLKYGDIFKNWLFRAVSTEIYFTIAFPDFVPPSLKGKGDRGKGSIWRNLPTIITRILASWYA